MGNAIRLLPPVAALAALLSPLAAVAGDCGDADGSVQARAQYWVCHGNDAYRAGDLHGAMRFYARAAALEPRSANAQCGMGLAYLDLGAPRKSFKRYSRALWLAPDHESALLGRAEAKRRLGFPQAALADLDRAASSVPGSVQAHADRGELLLKLRRADEALESLRRAAELDASRRERYEEERVAARGRPAWPGALAGALLAALASLALARRAGRRFRGDPEADRRAFAFARSGACLLLGTLWPLSLAFFFFPWPWLTALGVRPLGAGAFFAYLTLGSAALYWAQERCFGPLQDRLRGFGDSRPHLALRALRYLRLFCAQMLLNGVLVAMITILFVSLPPEALRDALPAWLTGAAAAALALAGNALFLPEALLWAYRARIVESGPLWEAARPAFRDLVPAPSLWVVPEPAEGALLVLTLPRRRVLVSANCALLLERGELEAVFAHEAAHIRDGHPAKNLLAALAAALGMYCLAGAAGAAAGEAGLLLSLPIWALLPLGMLAAVGLRQRANERAADRAALAAGAEPRRLLGALEKLHGHNLLCRRWSFCGRLFATHPPLEERARDILAWASAGAPRG